MTRPASNSARRKGTVRCAIYTRKSSEEGLEQEFNSLQAQREACEAFITSQRHEGWVCLPKAYADGGFSGATMERPALQRLLADITAGRVDIVVVYKIDRLTRSLTDFAKIVEIFDARGASFVSVTQQFNTTTSMGRLTLNILLSFAQFEREVIGERIRDKIAASKKKGMWMGGVPPLGYRVQDRKLVIAEGEAEIVRAIFRRYAELGSVRLVKDELEARGIKSKSWTSASGRLIGGKPFSRGALYLMLQNRLYRGEIVHKGQSHPGEHPPIIEPPLWDAVQGQLGSNTAERNSATRTRQPSLLAGMLFDGDGNRMNADPCDQQRDALPLLCLPPADHQGSDRAVRRAAHSSRRDRASRDQPDAPMACRSQQHLPGGTAFRPVNAAPADRASRRDRQDLARVA
jgi:DNA invertase Pin-like site-specific DNA recombinase